MKDLFIFNRKTKTEEKEEIYGKIFLSFLYKKNIFSKVLSFVICRFLFFSKLYGFFMKTSWSKRKIKPFVEKFNIKEEEFEKSIEEFSSFNDFFIRKLKEDSRPIYYDDKALIFPADGRYLAIDNIEAVDGFYVKGEKFRLEQFLQSKELAEEYKKGSMLIGRLAPVDYHRFHFSFDCVPSESKCINGYLFSVNPLAIVKNINIFAENKRVITILEDENINKVIYVEIGATNVGSIQQTYYPNNLQRKGDEKGYFELGGSSVVLIFKEGEIEFCADLLQTSSRKIEMKAQMGDRFATFLR